MNGIPRPRVLVLSRSYPSDVLPTLGLWVQRPTELLADQCDMQVVSPTPWCPPLPNIGPLRQYSRFRGIPQEETRRGIPVHRWRFVTGPGRSLYALESRSQIASLTRPVGRLRSQFPFDLVHAHMIYPEGAVAHRLARRLGVPFVVTEHAPWTERWFSSRLVRREALAAARAATAILAVSSSVQRSIVSYGIDPARVRVVPIGVDHETFELGASEHRRADQVLFVGWINFVKGVDVLLEAMRLLVQRGSPARLVLVGGALYRNTRLQEEKLRRMAASLDLGDRVVFLGRRPPAEVARLMAESAVVVLPSRAESFGAVLVEALACGTPVVATRCGGPEDIVVPEVGELVPVEDSDALADAIDNVLRNAQRFPPLDLRRYAIERFSWERVVPAVFDAYAAAGNHGSHGCRGEGAGREKARVAARSR